MNRIILADDHSFVRLGLIQILKDEYPSAIIHEVADGESLVKEVTQQDWDLVISDLDMPGRSGLEALQQIKLIKPDLPVLILSIYPEDLYAVRALKAGASGYLNKNAAPYELIKPFSGLPWAKNILPTKLQNGYWRRKQISNRMNYSPTVNLKSLNFSPLANPFRR